MNLKEKQIFKNTNNILKKTFQEVLKYDKNNEELKRLASQDEILKYSDYIKDYIFFIPEFFIYYSEENLKNIKIIDEEESFKLRENDEQKISSMVEIISKSDAPFEITDQKVKEFEVSQNIKNEEKSKIIEEYVKEINKITIENDFLNQEKEYQEKEFINKKEEILVKLYKIRNEDLVVITDKVKEIDRKIHFKYEGDQKLFFDDFYKFKEKFENAIKLFEEKNEIEDLEIFSFEPLLDVTEKKLFETHNNLLISKTKLKDFCDDRLTNLNRQAIESKREIQTKIEKQKEINLKLMEEITLLRKEENALTEKIRFEKENFLIERNALPSTNVFIELQNICYYDIRIAIIVFFSMILIGAFFYF